MTAVAARLPLRVYDRSRSALAFSQTPEAAAQSVTVGEASPNKPTKSNQAASENSTDGSNTKSTVSFCQSVVSPVVGSAAAPCEEGSKTVARPIPLLAHNYRCDQSVYHPGIGNLTMDKFGIDMELDPRMPMEVRLPASRLRPLTPVEDRAGDELRDEDFALLKALLSECESIDEAVSESVEPLFVSEYEMHVGRMALEWFGPSFTVFPVDFTALLQRVIDSCKSAVTQKVMQVMAEFLEPVLSVSLNNATSHGKVIATLDMSDVHDVNAIAGFMKYVQEVLIERTDLLLCLLNLFPPSLLHFVQLYKSNDEFQLKRTMRMRNTRQRKIKKPFTLPMMDLEDDVSIELSALENIERHLHSEDLCSKKRKRGRPRKFPVAKSCNSSSTVSIIGTESVSGQTSLSPVIRPVVNVDKQGMKLKSKNLSIRVPGEPNDGVPKFPKTTLRTRQVAINQQEVKPVQSRNSIVGTASDASSVSFVTSRDAPDSFESDPWTTPKNTFSNANTNDYSASLVTPINKKQKKMISLNTADTSEEVEAKVELKAKTHLDRLQEEEELASLGHNKLEKHIVQLQTQIRSIKHKHRKGAVCPRCALEQRLKVAYKVKARTIASSGLVKMKSDMSEPETEEPVDARIEIALGPMAEGNT